MSHQYEDLPQYGDDETDYAALEEYRSNVVQMPQPGAPAMTPEQVQAALDAMPDGRSRVSFSQPTPAHKRPEHGANASELRREVESRKYDPDVAERNKRHLDAIMGLDAPDCATPADANIDYMRKNFVLVGGRLVLSLVDPTFAMKVDDAANHFTSITTDGMPGLEHTKRGADGVEKRAFAVWLAKPKKENIVQQMTFSPGKPKMFYHEKYGRVFNRYTPLSWDFSAVEDVTWFIDHLNNLWGRKAQLFLEWLAYGIQKPEATMELAFLHINETRGSGRSKAFEIIRKVYGRYAAPRLNLAEMLETKHNTEVDGNIFFAFDEILIEGVKRRKLAEAVKEFIDNGTKQVNPKGLAKYEVVVNSRVLLASNYINGLPIEKGDRRIVVHIGNLPRLDIATAQRLIAAAERKSFINSFAKFLMEYDVSGFNPGLVDVDDEDHARVVGATMSPEDKMIAEIINSGVSILTSDMLTQLAKNYGLRGMPKDTLSAMKDAGKVTAQRLRVDGKQTRCWVFRDHERWRSADGREVTAQVVSDRGLIDI